MQQQRQHVRMVINQAARPGDGRAITSQLQQVLDRRQAEITEILQRYGVPLVDRGQ